MWAGSESPWMPKAEGSSPWSRNGRSCFGNWQQPSLAALGGDVGQGHPTELLPGQRKIRKCPVPPAGPAEESWQFPRYMSPSLAQGEEQKEASLPGGGAVRGLWTQEWLQQHLQLQPAAQHQSGRLNMAVYPSARKRLRAGCPFWEPIPE